MESLPATLQTASAESTAINTGQHLIFNFAKRAAAGDPDVASALVVGFGSILGQIRGIP